MKKLILLCALCLFGAGVVFGQAYSDLLYRDWAGLRAYAQVNKTLGDVRPDVVFMGNSITEGWFNQRDKGAAVLRHAVRALQLAAAGGAREDHP